MFPVFKLRQLPQGQQRKKNVLILEKYEHQLLGGASALSAADHAYLHDILSLVLEDTGVSPSACTLIKQMLPDWEEPAVLLRICNQARHALLATIGTFPAEWDLVYQERTQGAETTTRPFRPGIWVYAEDIRSPFNLGSIFRTAEAFGAEKLLISPLCVSPDHPRAKRSAMGCIDYLPWERKAIHLIETDVPVFALETGGIPLNKFVFPQTGMVVVGSEELGISPEGLERASYGRVSIPMSGIKASLNVGVAFGILMQAWISYLTCSASKPC